MARARTARGAATPARRSARAPARRRVRLDVDARRSQLIEHGLRAFSQQPYDSVSIDAIANELGISKGLLYHYFPTKRDFYVAVVRASSAQMVARTSIEGALPADERLQKGVSAWLDYITEHAPAFVALMRGGIGFDPEVAQVIDDTRRAMLERFLSLQGMDRPPAALRAAFWGWLGFCEAVSIDWLQHKDRERAEVHAQLCSAAVALVREVLSQAQGGPAA